MNTQEDIVKLAEFIIDEMSKKLHFKHYRIPIKKICNIPVVVDVQQHSKSIAISLESPFAYFIEEDDGESQGFIMYKRTYVYDEANNLQSYVNFLTAFTNDLQKFKFNKLTGDFETDTVEGIPLYNIITSVFGCDKVEFDWDKCSCCLEPTEIKTPCKHYCCIECWSKIPITIGEDTYVSQAVQKCPICRTELKGYF